MDGEVYLHLRINFTDSNRNAFGGDLSSAWSVQTEKF